MKKKITLIIVNILIIMLIIFLILIYNNKTIENDIYIDNTIENENINDGEIMDVLNEDRYYTVKQCLNTYISSINKENSLLYNYDENGEQVYSEENKEQIYQNIYSLLNKEYIEKENITIDNLDAKIEFNDSLFLYTVLEMQVYATGEIEHYIIKCMYSDLNLEYIKETYVEVILDTSNNTFAIVPLSDISNIEEVSIVEEIENIEVCEVNEYTNIVSTEENNAKEYLNIYKRLAIGKPEYLYDLLDDEYKQLRFPTYQEFEEYLEQKQQTILGINVNGYNYKKLDNYSQYVFIDQYDEYYVINQESMSEFSFMLDTYTIDTEVYKENYEKSDDKNKTALNLEKIKEALNNYDYEYIYNKLDESFRNSNFDSMKEFENYIKENSFESNSFTYIQYEEMTDFNIMIIEIANNENESETITKQFIVQLLDETDFVMSFNID